MSDAYEVLTGMNYPPNGDPDADEVRREPGAIVTDLPAASIPWLLADDHIRPAPDKKAARAEKLAAVVNGD